MSEKRKGISPCGAALCVLMAVLIYRMWAPDKWWLILRDTTRESVMILMIIAALQIALSATRERATTAWRVPRRS